MPITPLDEYPLQQLPTTFDHVDDSDRRWFERYWIHVHDPEGSFALTHGVGVYPNLGLIDAFASIQSASLSGGLRSERSLRHDRLDTSVGPVSVRVVDPLRRLAIRLDANDYIPADYEIEVSSAWQPVARTPMPFERLPSGKVHQRCSTFVQSGRAFGRLTIDGETMSSPQQGWFFAKSNAWGLRSHAGGIDVDPTEDRWLPSAPFLVAQVEDRLVVLLENEGEVLDSADHRWPVRCSVELTPNSAGQMVGHWTVSGAPPGLDELRFEEVGVVSLADGYSGYKDHMALRPNGPLPTQAASSAIEGSLQNAQSGRDDRFGRVVTGSGVAGSGVLELGNRPAARGPASGSSR